MSENNEIYGASFKGAYGVDGFPEIDNPKTVFVFKNGTFVQITEGAPCPYLTRTTTLGELIRDYGEVMDVKKFKEI